MDKNKGLLSLILEIKTDEIKYIEEESYVFGMYNCCYYHVYFTSKRNIFIRMSLRM